MKVTPASVTSYKRGVSDFSAQIAKMKADGCDMVLLGTVLRETIGAMGEAKKLGWDVTFLGATPTNVLKCRRSARKWLKGSMPLQASKFPTKHREGKSEGLARQLQEVVRHRRQHPGDHRLQCGDDARALCQQGRQGSHRPEHLDAPQSGATSRISSLRRRPCSPRPTISHHLTQVQRSRTAAGCW